MNISSLSQHMIWMTILAVSLTMTAFAGTASAEDNTSIEEVKQQMKEAAIAIKKYSVEQRDQAEKQVKASLNKLDAEIDRLQQRLDKKSDDMDQVAREKARTTLADIRKQRNQLSEWYGGMQHSTDKAWLEIKSGFVKSFNTLQQSFDKAQKNF